MMIKELRKLEEEGLITLRPHNELPLFIANYTPTVQYDRLWDSHPLLKSCRGLIVDEDGEVVARPFPKFFNYQEHMELDSLEDIPTEPFDVYDKIDGSLGILFNYEEEWYIATRGSFHSEQAEYAMEHLLPKYKYKYLPTDTTYLLEIIYPENRIVVNYGDMNELIMIAAIHTETGEEYDIYEEEYIDLGFPLAQKYSFTSFEDIIEKMSEFDDGNTEGFVIRFRSGLRIKVKLEEYVKLHRLLTGLTKRTIWELLKDGQDIETIYDTAPDEVYDWVEETVNELQSQYKKLEYSSKIAFALAYCRLYKKIGIAPKYLDEADQKTYLDEKRKAFAKIVTSDEKIKEKGLTPFMFRMYDGKKIEDLLWKSIKPEHEPLEATI